MHATNKPFHIEKRWVYEAYQAIRSNGKAAGVDGQTLEQFETDLTGNLYKIWNRMSSGTCFPPPVRAVPIPKKSGGETISSSTGKPVWSACLPDGSRVRRESHARFCERPEVKFQRPTQPHICGRSRETGYFTVHRKTIGKRMAAKLKDIGQKLRQRLHESIGTTRKWLISVVRGYFQYHAVPGNEQRLKAFRNEALRLWFRQLRRRSQRSRWS